MRGTLGIALVLAAIAALLHWESLLGGKVLTQADALNAFPPWSSHAPAGFRPGNALLLDQATGFLPWLDFQAQELRRGELPLWNPYNYCGTPLAGTYQSATFWPLNWVYFAFPSWRTHAWLALARLWLAGLFALLFLRRLGIGAVAAGAGAVAFMLCGFMVVWLNHPHTACALFLPALLWAVERMAARPPDRPASGGRGAALFGLLVALMLCAGHVQTALHLGFFTAAYAAFRLVCAAGGARLSPRGLGLLAAGGALGVLLAAPQILPFVEYLRHSQAAQVFAQVDTVAHEGVTRGIVLMVAPRWFGAPHTHDYTGPLGPNVNYNELIGGYVGRAVLLLALLQAAWLCWRSRRATTLFFVLVVTVSALVGWQVEPVYSWFDALPLVRSTKLMRNQLFVAFGLAVLAALALDRLAATRPRLRAAPAVALVLVAAELLWFARGYNPQVDPGTLLPETRVAAFLREHQGAHRALAIDNATFKPNANVFERVAMVSGYDSMEDRSLAELVLRMTQRPPAFPFISQIGAFDRAEAFPLLRLLGVKHLLSSGPLPPPLRLVLDAELQVYENPLVMPRAFLARDVVGIADRDARIDHLTGPAFDPWIAITESETGPRLDGWPGSAVPADEAAEVRLAAPRELEVAVRTPRRALLVLTDTWDPGWTATVRATAGDATTLALPIERVDHALRGVWLEPGSWLVRFAYDPWSVRGGLVLAALSLAALAWLAAARRWRHPPGPVTTAAAGT